MHTRLDAEVGAGSANARRSYVRHRPEDTVLYQTVEQHARAFFAALGEQGSCLPGFMVDEFDAYTGCGSKPPQGFS